MFDVKKDVKQYLYRAQEQKSRVKRHKSYCTEEHK